MNFSFAGCGFLGLYHTGVVCCIQKYAPQLILSRCSGASAGAIAACALLCQQPLDEMVSQGLRIAKEARDGPLGPFSPSFDINKILAEGLHEFLPEDVHLIVSGKLHVSLTRARDGRNVIISQFESKEDLIQAIVTSTFIPVFSGILPPKFRGVRYIDGGFSNNSPIINEQTITVSPFSGQSDICPNDNSYQLYHINVNNSSIELSKHNIYRFKSVLFPPKPEILSELCKQGFEDTLSFLYRNSLLNCTRCLEVQSTYVVEPKHECNEYDPECSDCKTYSMEVLTSSMPEQVVQVFQEAIEKANDGIINWMKNHNGLKILTLPYTIPADLAYATTVKLISVAPILGSCLWRLGKRLLKRTVPFAAEPEIPSADSKISLHVVVAEYDSKHKDKKVLKDIRRNSKMDLNFSVNLEKSDLPPTAEHRKRRFSATQILSRKPSLVFNNPADGSTYEHILGVTSRHEPLITYRYMDKNNKMNVTEIFGIDENEVVEFDESLEEQELNSENVLNSITNHKCNSEGGCKRNGADSDEHILQDTRPESDQLM